MKRLFKKNNVVSGLKPLKKEFIADMDINGIRFDDEVSIKLNKDSEELYCHYSGLPSVLAYQ